MAEAEEICGYFAFDWQQTVTLSPHPQPYLFADAKNPNVILYAPYNDPPPHGWAFQARNNGTPNAVRIPVFYNLYVDGLDGSLDTNVTSTYLLFGDQPTNPCLPGGSGKFCYPCVPGSPDTCTGQTAPLGSVDGYTTHLVGIQGSLDQPYVCDTGIGFSCTDSYNGTSGGIAVRQSTQPVDPGSGTGGITLTAVSDSPPSSSTPMLLGSDQITVTVSSLTMTGAVVTVTNIGATSIDGPIQIVADSLTTGVTLAKPSGTFGGWSFLTVPNVESLSPGQSVSMGVEFSNPGNQTVSFAPIAYSGEMD